MNRETACLLAYLGLQPPRAIEDVYLRVVDVMVSDVPTLHADQTLREGGLFMAVMVLTDILEERSFLLVNDEKGLGLVAHAFGVSPNDSGLLELPGVMSWKKQVVPPLAAALK